MIPRRVLIPAAALACLTTPLAACSSSDDSSTPTTSAAPATAGTGGGGGGAGTTVTSGATSSTTGSASATALQGTWNADARDLLAANTANLGTPAMGCSGPATLTFNADGTLSNSGQVTCSMRGVTGTGQFSSTGNYSVNGNTVTVSDAQTSGQLQIGAASVPFSPGLTNGTFTYEITGSTLKLSFDGGAAGQLTQTWTRS